MPLKHRIDAMPLSLVWNDERPSAQLRAFRDGVFRKYPMAARAAAVSAAAKG